jgi:folate/biopterin transporter
MIFLTVQNLGSAMADVVIDAMIAEAVRLEKASFAGDLQSVSWFAMAVGGVCGSLLGGYALSNLKIETIFLLFTVLPALQLLSCALVEESPANNEPLPELLDSNEFEEKSLTSNDNYPDTSKSNTRRRKGQKKGKKGDSNGKSETQKKQSKSLASQWFQSLKAATFGLGRAFKQPIILRPMAWFFIAHITVPNLSTVMFYYQTEVLQLDAAFLGTARVVGWLGLMFGTFIYNRYLQDMTLRKSLLFAHIGLSVTILLDMVLVSRANVGYGVSDKTMVLFGSALGDAINQLKFMPFLILSGRLCPPGIEGTLFALFMSINNLGNTVGSFMGAGLASLLGISSGSFDNMFMGLAIQVFCTYIPVLFLFLIPKEATGVSAS